MSSATISAEHVAWPPLHPFLACIVATCLTSAMLTDIAYASTAVMMWADFSAWLISAGTILAWLFGLVGLIEFGVRPALRTRHHVLPYAIGNLVVIVLATINMLIHTRDAWTSVVPTGLVLSILTVVTLLATAWFAVSVVSSDRVEVIRS
ncbi:DUF2231 domain-containing protein [Mesorhizobium sp. BR1-1-16]|uniref:DUF2231 domain-containing protein n=1 Tax=Mesorhizobium sp. BR1-1-16 TaxID=2876653 RepID=UPI001CCB53B5|nr:DUF2231 domain-containing protein [Mesorhizobium sp. BR1-1-16]MBZ9935674.1 DUF2231 domain-containing protein [Mesorhizobium sp. BR1-1-16]